MPRVPTYGETAYRSWCRLVLLSELASSPSPADFDGLSDKGKEAWENIAATVIAEFRKRQRDLSHQTPKDEVPF
jgi:hypothetical protein